MDKQAKRIINGKVVVYLARRFQISTGFAYVVYSRFLKKYPGKSDDKDSAESLFLIELEDYQNEERFKRIEQHFDLYGLKEFYHITHIENLKGILKCGLKPKNLLNQNDYKDISNQDIQQARSAKSTPFFENLNLHDFVPLFIKQKPPMHYSLKTIQDELVYLHVKTLVCGLKNVVFSDGNARSNKTKFFNDWQNLSNLDWNILNQKYWFNENEEIHKENKRKRSAEVLVPQVISPKYIESIGVLNKEQKNKVNEIVKNSNCKMNIYYDTSLRID